MSKDERNRLFYVCSLIEYISRATKNNISYIVRLIGKNEIQRQLELADVNHCLSFQEVADEIIEYFDIKIGCYDSISKCLYKVPSHISIGKNYQRLIEDIQSDKKSIVDTIYEVMTSFIVEEMSNYNSSFFYSNRQYIKACYESNTVLD